MSPTAWLADVLVWQTMMIAMMVPTAYPWLRAAHVLAPERPWPAGEFGAGYLAVWFPFCLVLATVDRALMHTALPPWWRAAVLAAAGLYQFAPLKRACLRHCRTPFGSFLARWHERPAGMFQLGVEHGLFCLGCCWALMATTIAVGMMNLAWMALLTAAVFAEQTLPRTAPGSTWVRPALGIGLILAAAAVA